MRTQIISFAMAGALLAASGTAFAQDPAAPPAPPPAEPAPAEAAPPPPPPPPPEPAPAPAQAQVQAQGEATGMGLPQAGAEAGDSDHDMMVGTFAVGFLGVRTVPVGNLGPISAGDNAGSADAPVIGIRYWISPVVGIDAGIGFGFNTGKNETDEGGVSTDETVAGVSRGLVHFGVPLALAGAGHFSFQIIPEANVGFATQSVDGDGVAVPDRTNSGFLLGLGARAGAEVHFGFIGIPQLSLQGSIGLGFDWTSRKSKEELPGVENTYSQTRALVSTAYNNDPWAIFTNSIAALYYF